jgi:hypothetical protein
MLTTFREQTWSMFTCDFNVVLSACSTWTLRSSSVMYFNLRSFDFAADSRLLRILKNLEDDEFQ